MVKYAKLVTSQLNTRVIRFKLREMVMDVANIDVSLPRFEFTVHNFTTRRNELLLVHEIGEEKGKPSKWGMSGGSVLPDPIRDKRLTEKQVIEISFDQIKKLVRDCHISQEAFKELMESNPPVELIFFLTAVREALEEASVLIQPICELMRETTEPRLESQCDSNHQVVVIQSYVLDGEPKCNYKEIDDIGWFQLDSLPEDLYVSHRRRIHRSSNKLHLDQFQEITANV